MYWENDQPVYNDKDLFKWGYYDFDTGKEIPTVNCTDLIESFTALDDDERNNINSTLVSPY